MAERKGCELRTLNAITILVTMQAPQMENDTIAEDYNDRFKMQINI